jgi:hypothetical protein
VDTGRTKELVTKAESAVRTAPQESKEDVRPNAQPAKVRTASKEQFKKAQRKTNAAHAGLFRRLAK